MVWALSFAGVALFVVPMFLVTPVPRNCARYFALCVLAGTVFPSVSRCGTAMGCRHGFGRAGHPGPSGVCGHDSRHASPVPQQTPSAETLPMDGGNAQAWQPLRALWLLQTVVGTLQQWSATPLLLAWCSWAGRS